MIDFYDRTRCAQGLFVGKLLHRQDRPTRDVELVENVHGLELGLGHGPLLNDAENMLEPRQPRVGRGIVRIGLPFRLADHVADRAPHRRLSDEIDVSVWIALISLAFEDPARLTAAGIVARPRHRVAEGYAFAVLAVFGQRTVRQPLLVA